MLRRVAAFCRPLRAPGSSPHPPWISTSLAEHEHGHAHGPGPGHGRGHGRGHGHGVDVDTDADADNARRTTDCTGTSLVGIALIIHLQPPFFSEMIWGCCRGKGLLLRSTAPHGRASLQERLKQEAEERAAHQLSIANREAEVCVLAARDCQGRGRAGAYHEAEVWIIAAHDRRDQSGGGGQRAPGPGPRAGAPREDGERGR